MTTCALCEGRLKLGQTTQVYELATQLLIVRGVPVLACQTCGETFLTADTTIRLDEIVAQ